MRTPASAGSWGWSFRRNRMFASKRTRRRERRRVPRTGDGIRPWYFIRLVAAAVLASVSLGACGGPDAPGEPSTTEPPAVTGRAIVLADVDVDSPTKKLAKFQPLADYLGSNLAGFGITGGGVRIAPDLETIAAWLVSGEVDLYFDSMYPATIVADQSGARAILRRWRGGVGEYYSVIFARADSGLSTVADLLGATVALDEPVSTSGFLLPVALFIQAGLEPVEVAANMPPPDPMRVGYVFSGDDENTVQWVISGKAMAGAVDSVTYSELPEDTRRELVVISETETVPRQVVLVRPGLDEDLLNAIKELLTGLERTPEGLKILETHGTTRFDEFPEGIEKAMQRMRGLYDLVTQR